MQGLMAVSMQPLAHGAGAACCSPPGSSLLQRGSVNGSPLPLEDMPDVFFLSKTGNLLHWHCEAAFGGRGKPR